MPNPKPKLIKPRSNTNNTLGLDSTKINLSQLEITKFGSTMPKSLTTQCIAERTKPIINVNKRPVTLMLKKTEKYKLSLNKPNQSLPISPVCEELKQFKEHCKKNVNRFAMFAQNRRSCSYFIGLEDKIEDVENLTKSFESLPVMNDRNLSNSNQLSDDGQEEEEEEEDNGNFSDDSLEGDFKNPPRRCVSDYQINMRMESDNLYRKALNCSQESILSDASVESFSKGSMEMLDYSSNAHDRHSSASFFLSRRKSGRSQESILTDDSDYQMFPLREAANHPSAESVLTDDSDSLVKSAPLEMLFDSHYKRKRQSSVTFGENTDDILEMNEKLEESENSSSSAAVFRSKSLQDTSLNKLNSVINYMEEHMQKNQKSIYYEYNFNNDDGKFGGAGGNFSNSNSLPRDVTCGAKTMSRDSKSMLMLSDYVAHKPPKPKRNSASRTQSMRSRSRPLWVTNYSFNSQEKSKAIEIPNQSQKDCERYSRSLNYNYSSSAFNLRNKDECCVPQQRSTIFDKRDDEITRSREDSLDRCDKREQNKDTGEPTYDSLEPTPSNANETLDNQKSKSNVEMRMNRAIEGTVKLLSKEFENLVRREQQCLLMKDSSSNNAVKLEAERDVKAAAGVVTREFRLHSSGEDGSSTSTASTSTSSCATSPKRLWPPASRCQMKWTKTLPTINQSGFSSDLYSGTRAR